MGRAAWSLLLVSALLGAGSPAFADTVVVFPLDARGVAEASAKTATDRLVATLKTVPNLRAIDPKTVEQKLRVNLTEQARACEYDVFCLVEIGEILQVERILIGHLRRPSSSESDSDRLELKLIVLDVQKAVIGDVLIWKLPQTQGGVLEDAVEAAARKMFSPPDAEIVLDLDPPAARVYFYGERVQVPKDGVMRYWSGSYYAHVISDGYHPLDLKLTVPKTSGKTRIPITMEQDPLWVESKKGGPDRTGQPFDKTSRREGSGVGAKTVGVDGDKAGASDGGSGIFSNPLPFAMAGAGIAVTVIGSLVMSGAQSKYNDLSVQDRFKPGVTVTADVAMTNRDGQRSAYRNGSLLVTAGVLAVVGAGVWLIVERVLLSEPTPATRAAVGPAPIKAGLDPVVSRAAASLVHEALAGGGP